ncbi:thiamine pyrophosphate-dependent enzyme [Halobacillus aidingensis]|uniref:Acetolactate synthase-1/2/3 large subunit n=1 Tax=Halobacillus aidingensis TaxID=240303 RepID=A0A1H0LKV8_HALAD|nr:thiamine pyrophosphate-dependent enzyme [Halobacillus aidingensis]SDO68666.1 acetolactate synthase-1/2/3 large subunit [Halobacillus aidingensis]
MDERHMTSAEAIVSCLQRQGISKVFCVPGESYLPVMDAILKEPDIELISARHEGGAAFMAEGYAKASGTPGVVMATRGVGAGNLAIGVHTAYQDSTPMVVLLGQVHTNFSGREGFQEVDLEAFFRPIAKWVAEIREPPRTPELIQRAIRIAMSGRPGPVVIALPEDVLKKEALMSFGPVIKRPAPKPSDQEVIEVVDRLRLAERPLILAGGGVKLAGAEMALKRLAYKWGAPIVSAFRRHDVFPNDDIHYCGHLGLGIHPNILETVAKADTVLAVGTRLSEVTTQDYSLFKGQTLIHCDIDDSVLGKVYPPDVGIVADANEMLEALADAAYGRDLTSWTSARRKAYEATLVTEGRKTLNGEVISLLQENLPEDSILTNDAGNFAGWLHTYFQFKKHRYIGPTSGAMGYGMPAALGAKLANPDKSVVSLSGDGGFMMTLQELETAVRYDIPVISIVFNNRMYGTIRMHQEIHYPGEVIGTDLGEVAFWKVAENLGAAGFHVKTAEEFRHALDQSLVLDKPVVIEVETDPERISLSKTITQLRKKGGESK